MHVFTDDSDRKGSLRNSFSLADTNDNIAHRLLTFEKTFNRFTLTFGPLF